MVRTQIQITPEQARALKQMAAREGKSAAELICISLDDMLRDRGVKTQADLRRKASAAAGKISGPKNLSEEYATVIPIAPHPIWVMTISPG